MYVGNNRKRLFQKHPTFYDFDKLIAPHLLTAPKFIQEHFPFSDHDNARREKTTRYFFENQYPKLFYGIHKMPQLLAETFAIYMTIHPMTDGNGTVIHSLIDHALLAHGCKPIPAWNKAKIGKPLTELREWIQGNVLPLERWFERRLSIANSPF